MRKNKKSQVAMEFLMTYGWAILIVLAAIGFLAYFGVLNPDNFKSDYCVCKYANMTSSNSIIKDSVTYIECENIEYFLNDDKTRIEQQISYSIFYCDENKTLIPVK